MANGDSFFELVRHLVNGAKSCSHMTLKFGEDYEVDVEVLVLRVKDKRTGVEHIVGAPAGNYDPPDAHPAPLRLQ